MTNALLTFSERHHQALQNDIDRQLDQFSWLVGRPSVPPEPEAVGDLIKQQYRAVGLKEPRVQIGMPLEQISAVFRQLLNGQTLVTQEFWSRGLTNEWDRQLAGSTTPAFREACWDLISNHRLPEFFTLMQWIDRSLFLSVDQHEGWDPGWQLTRNNLRDLYQGHWVHEPLVKRLLFYRFYLALELLPREAASTLDRWAQLVEPCWSCWAFPDRCYVILRPDYVSRDDSLRPHAENHAAIQWAGDSGYSLYSWHGVVVPPAVILEPERITIQTIGQEPNLPVRRALLARYGKDRYLKETREPPKRWMIETWLEDSSDPEIYDPLAELPVGVVV